MFIQSKWDNEEPRWGSLDGNTWPFKVASNQAFLASASAIKNITALLPPALQTYVQTTVGHLSEAVAGSNEYLVSQGVSPTLLYSTIAGTAAALALPLSMMSRFGWGSSRDAISPYASQSDSQGVPHVTDDDFSYITSEDLEDSLQSPSRTYDPQGRRAPPSATLDDDVLLIKNKGITYPVHFPAYSIGDGKLHVSDVRDRVGLVMDLSDRRSRRLKMLYKGRHLKEQDIPIRDYGVKNNSELLVVVPEGRISDEDGESSSEEVVVTEDSIDQQKSRKKKSKARKKKKERPGPAESSVNLEVPGREEGRRASPDPSIHPSRVPSPAVPSGPSEQLDAIRSHFDAKLLPLCRQFINHTPTDKKKCEDEHRKLSETVLQHTLLKLDEVNTGGDPDIRAKRKELVNYVQDILRQLDERQPSSSGKSRGR
ncbi:BAG domain-containing protein [Annulohypoxylon truncatum]|uniref:BAG domain-containing protein n=1 Tax=Annulohypoxylon truncatum TaxID=327061 RepID=UPI002007D69B|nr:BAG domain-containing protein [Annulohypoxylon truncatum]KAI1206371.1 BAG domain-containing protein [Annulohypoxylon truncatum]